MQRVVRVVVALIVCTAVPAGAVGGVTATAEHETQSACEFPVTVTDATGTTVEIEEEPQEIVVTAPNVAQHIWEIGAEEKVTGMPVNFFTAYLEGSEERTNVVNDQGMVVQESVVGLEPDLVLAPNVTSEQAIGSLRDAGLTVYHYPVATDLDNVIEQVETTGQLVGACEGADETTAEMEETITQIEEAVADEESPTVFYDLGFPFTAGSGTVENDIIETAGGDNIAADVDSDRPYFQISEEVIAAEDPEWIVKAEGAELPEVAAIQQSTAVQNDQIIEVNSNFISQHGPRNVIPLEKIGSSLHPDAFSNEGSDSGTDDTPTDTPTPEPSTPTATPDEPTATPTDTPTRSDTATATETPEDDGDGAGFAVVTVLVALGVLVALARRD